MNIKNGLGHTIKYNTIIDQFKSKRMQGMILNVL